MICPKCGSEMVWQSDANYDEVFGEDDGFDGVVSFWACPECGSEFTEVTREPKPGQKQE